MRRVPEAPTGRRINHSRWPDPRASRHPGRVELPPPQSPLHDEAEAVRAVREWVRGELYSVTEGGWRARATTAIAASAAEDAYRLGEQLPDWWNETSAEWREYLRHVWAFLEGDASEHYTLSRALANFLLSPLNHNEGQDGPDDFDRPWTVASYSAVASAVMWGVDFAVVAVDQIFECIDLKYGDEFPEERRAEVSGRLDRLRAVVTRVVSVEGLGRSGLTVDILASIRS